MRAEFADCVSSFGEDQRRAGFQPIDTGAEGHLSGLKSIFYGCEIE
jgi:hypothetical protein